MLWSLEIEIQQSKFKAGDTVSGCVHIVSQHTKGQEVDIGSIVVDFTGWSTTRKYWPCIPSSVQLFSLKKTLLNGPKRFYVPYVQAENFRNEWPFSFTLPFNCSLSERDPTISPPYFNPDPNQPLPISFVDGNAQNGSCSIVYELQATLKSSLKDDYEDCTRKVEISVYRPRHTEQPAFRFNTKSAAFTYRSLLLLSREERQIAHRPPSMKEKFKLKSLSNQHLPKAVFTVRVQTPSAAVIGQPLPIILQVDYDGDASTIPSLSFLLTRVSIHLCEETSIWGLKNAREHGFTRWTNETLLQNKVFETRPQIEGHLDLRKVMDTRIHHDVVPTFKTFNIARTYSLKVFIRLESPGKEHLVFGDYKRCTLFAPEFEPQTRAYDEPAPVTEDEEDDPPPPYDSAAQETVPEYPAQLYHTAHHEFDHADYNETLYN